MSSWRKSCSYSSELIRHTTAANAVGPGRRVSQFRRRDCDDRSTALPPAWPTSATELDHCPLSTASFRCDEGGLTSEEAQRRIEIFGPNKLTEKSENAFLQFLVRPLSCSCPRSCRSQLTSCSPALLSQSFMWNPLSWVMEGAALVAIALSNGEGRAPDWQDFVGIVLLLFVSLASCHCSRARLVI